MSEQGEIPKINYRIDKIKPYLQEGEEFIRIHHRSKEPRRLFPKSTTLGPQPENPTLEETVRALEAGGFWQDVRILPEAYFIDGKIMPDHVTLVGKRVTPPVDAAPPNP